jgi:magnesium transporter
LPERYALEEATMLTAYAIDNRRLVQLQPEAGEDWLQHSRWLELVDPDETERMVVASVFGLPLPDTKDVDELEASAHHVTYGNGLQVNSLFFHQLEDQPRNTNVSFIYDGKRLVSLSTREIPHARLLRMRNQRGTLDLEDALDLLLSLLEIKVDTLADEMEHAYRTLEDISRLVLGRDADDLEEAIDGLAEQEDLVGKVRLCLMDGQRDLKFLFRQRSVLPEQREWIGEMLGDIETLLPHNTFLSEKADFLLNTAQGFLNIEQSQIMKIFSIVALVFLPPTLVAAIYGMNFRLMPELDWPWGYPIALGLMVVAGISPYLYFKRKGWF